MDIFTIAPFAAASLKWQETPGQWTLTLVCKLTLSLEPGVCTVAPVQEKIHERDQPGDETRGGGLYAPSDLVPYKAYPDVALVGRVTAPPGAAARGELARLAVGSVDRTLPLPAPGEAVTAAPLGPVAARWPDGHGPASITLAPSPVIEAPIAMDPDAAFFQSAPADQQLAELAADEAITLVHLHPHIPHLATRLPGIRPRTRVEIEGLPPWELELAPDTLWIDADRSICTVTFRGELPLDGRDQPGRIFLGVERPGEEVQYPEVTAETQRQPPLVPPVPAPVPPPTASILPAPQEDDDDDFEQTQTNDDALSRTRAQPVPFAPARALPFGPGPSASGYKRSAPPSPPPPPPARPSQAAMARTGSFSSPVRSRTPTWLGGVGLEPSRTGPPGTSTAEMPAAPLLAIPPAAPSVPGAPPPVHVPAPAPSVSGAPLPGASSGKHAPIPGPVPAPPVRTPPPPPPLSQILRPAEPAPVNLAAASNRAAGLDEGSGAPGLPYTAPHVPPPALGAPSSPGPVRRASTPSFPAVGGTTVGQATVAAGGDLRPVPPPRPSSDHLPLDGEPPPRRADPRALATAAFLGAADASTAAAGPRDDGARDRDRAPSAQPVTPSQPRTLIDFLWYSPELPPRLMEHRPWKELAEPDRPPDDKVEEPPPEEELPPDAPPRRKKKPAPPPEKTPEEKARQEKAHVTRVLARGAPTLDIEGALFSAVTEDGVLTPPLLVVPGDLELPFDEVETLKVLVSAAAPLALGDKKLKETLDLANEALGTPLGSSPEVAASFSMRVREAWIRANRILSPDYLDVHTRRVLLEQRKYQLRDLMGAQWIRALLHGPMTERPVPAYLPAELSRRLPLFVKFPARLIAEALPAQDQNETHPAALRVLALSRTVTARPHGSAR